jgi:quinol-cytochrome oxidoreductase complex cytochrome b subunit
MGTGRERLRNGPGAATAETREREGFTPIVVVHEGGHMLEPEYKRLPIGPDHILYPVLVGLALFPILLGSAGHHLADDMPDDETHPFFPDHFWPYPIIAVLMVVTVGLLSGLVQKNLELEQSADPRAVVLPRPDWYFLWLFQMLKLGNELVMSLVIPPLMVLWLIVWPFIDQVAGRRIARRRGMTDWPVPGRNFITGGIFVLFLGVIAFLQFWALIGVTLPWIVLDLPPNGGFQWITGG